MGIVTRGLVCISINIIILPIIFLWFNLVNFIVNLKRMNCCLVQFGLPFRTTDNYDLYDICGSKSLLDELLKPTSNSSSSK
jgi:hypothetical protein